VSEGPPSSWPTIPAPPLEPLDQALVAETVAGLSDRLAAQEDLLAALVDRLEQEDVAQGQWTWRYLKPDQEAALLAELTDWVTWLIDRYQLGSTRHQIPVCWAQHPVAVEELTALMVAWKAAYSGRSRAPRDDLINWHDRWLWPCLTRLNEQLSVWNGCRGGQHAERTLGP
jgi:hypothetical protein